MTRSQAAKIPLLRATVSHPVFQDLPAAVMSSLRSCASIRTLAPGEALYRADEPYRGEVYLISDGEIEVRRISGEVYWAGRGDILGLSNFLDRQPYTSSATAGAGAVLRVMPHNALERLERKHPEIERALNRYIARRIRNWSPSRQVLSGALAQPARAVMKSPLATCSPQITLCGAFETMRERKVGSLVVLDADGRLQGLLTYASLCRAVLLDKADPGAGIGQAACEAAVTVDPETPLWKVEETQAQAGVKYLVVAQETGPVGMISQTDILRSLIAHESSLVTRIQDASDLATLTHLHRRMGEVAAQALESNRHASAAVRIISETHLAIQRRCVALTLDQLQRAGAGPAPAAYAVLIMGSGGRKEMLLAPDQDNGIILADTPAAATPEARSWFTRFGRQLNDNLARVGYELCRGDIMARNPQFHKPLAEWQRQISHMVRHPGSKAARWSNIVFDFDTLYGDDTLTGALRRHVQDELGRHPKLLGFMVEDDAAGRPPIGWFNRLITTDTDGAGGTVDIKRNGLRIIADAARIFALHAGIQSRNTHDRLLALVRLGVLDAELVETAISAYNVLHELLLTHQIAQVRRGEPPDKKVRPNALALPAREALRESMLAVKRMQGRLQGQYGL